MKDFKISVVTGLCLKLNISHSQMFATLFNPQNAICFGGELLRQSKATLIAGRMSMNVYTWTNMDLSRWKNIWIARDGANQPPHSSVEQELEEGKNSPHMFSTPGAWALFYSSWTIAAYFHGDAGWELVLRPELPGYCRELEQGPADFHHHTWQHVSVTLQVMEGVPEVQLSDTSDPSAPTDTSLSGTHVMLFTQQLGSS